MTEHTSQLEERGGFTSASWVTVALVLLLVGGCLAQMVYRFMLPSDGWSLSSSGGFGDQVVFVAPLTSEPTPLHPGDELLAVDGRSVSELAAGATLLQPITLSGWEAGHVAEYIVLRDGQRLTVQIPLRRLPPSALIRQLANGSLDYTSLALDIITLLVFCALFVARPALFATRLLLTLSVIFLLTDVTRLVPPGVSDALSIAAFWPDWLYARLTFPLIMLPMLAQFFLVFPTRKAPMRRAPGLTLAALYGIPGLVVLALALASASSLPSVPTLLSVARPAIILAPVLVIIVSGAHSLFKARGATDRAQIQWVVWGSSIAVIGGPELWALSEILAFQGPALDVAIALAELALPVSFALAIYQFHLFDIDLIINRTLVYVALTLVVASLYIIVVGGVGTLLQARGNLFISLLATGLIAVLFHPLREYLQRGVNRLLYGERQDPYQVISRLGQRIEATIAPEAVLPIAAESVAQALHSPYVAILTDNDQQPRVAAQYGAVAPQFLRIPLVYQAEQVGELRVAPRSNRLEYSPADRRLLDDLARQIGLAVHAARLTADLRRSRERLITLREEERRRLRRDLHDGLGPRIAAQTLKLGSARALLTRDSALADTLLRELEEDISAALASIRRLVYNLRPPLLDQLGLVGAVKATVTEFQLSADGSVETAQTAGQAMHSVPMMTLDVVDDLPTLPAAVEVAAYHIIQEAVTNVVRHANARTCHIQVGMALVQGRPALQLEVRDDGEGLPVPVAQAGVGLASMRERAEELGGVCQMTSLADSGGTLIQAMLPLSLATGSDETAQTLLAPLPHPSGQA